MQDFGKKFWNIIEKIACTCFICLFKLVGKIPSENQMDTLVQFLKFGIVGVSNTLISYLLYSGSLLIFRRLKIFHQSDYLIAQVIQFVLSVLWSFYWNNKKVFVLQEGEKRSMWQALLKTYISYSFTGLFLNSALLVLWIRVLGISEFIAPIINLLVSVPLNFIINKFWAFRKVEK